MTCEICHEGDAVTVRNGYSVCQECADSMDYYTSLTPEEQRADDESQARYVAETTGQDW